MLFGRRSGDDDRRQQEDRRRFIPLSFYIWCGQSLLLRFVRALFRWFGNVLKWSLISVGTVTVLLVLGGVAFWHVPEIMNAVDRQYPDWFDTQFGSTRSLVVKLSNPAYYAEQSEVLAQGERVACISSPEHRVKIDDLADVPLLLRGAVIASEDKSFYRHQGVDMAAIVRAAFRQFILHESSSGASTLSMQIAKELRGGTGRRSTGKEKVQDIITALRIERTYSKDQILLRYVNMPYFGRGQYGVESASRAYFAKSARDLTAHQAAFIISLINKPALPDRSFARNAAEGVVEVAEANWVDVTVGTRRVLERMKEDGYVTSDVFARASDAIDGSLRVEMIPRPSGCSVKDYFLEAVRVSYKDRLPLNTGGLTIAVTRDDALQAVLTQAVELTVRTYLARHETDPDNALLRAAALAIQFNGDVLAEVGNIDYRRLKYDVITTGWRQPGSTFKIFTYGGLVEKLVNDALAQPSPPPTLDALVEQVTKDCVVLDAPIGVSLGRGRGVKIIQNFHSLSGKTPQYWGSMKCKEAVGRSQNTAAIRAGARAGIKGVIDLTYRLGMPKDALHLLQPYPTTAIGASEVNPLGMTGAISFVNGGYKVTPRFVHDVCKDGRSLLAFDDDGRPAACDPKGDRRETPERVLHPAVSMVMTEVLRGPLEDAFGTAKSLRRGVIPGMDPLGSDIWKLKPSEKKERTIAFPFESSGEIAGKTGTATNADGRTSDVWLILFVPGPEAHPEKGVMLLFWMGKDSKDHPLGERGAKGGGIRPETGGRNWSHSASLVLSFLQRERGLLREGNKFRPMYEDEVLSALREQQGKSVKLPGDREEVIIDPTDPQVDLSVIREFHTALGESVANQEIPPPLSLGAEAVKD